MKKATVPNPTWYSYILMIFVKYVLIKVHVTSPCFEKCNVFMSMHSNVKLFEMNDFYLQVSTFRTVALATLRLNK